MFREALVVSRADRQEATALAERIAGWLRERGLAASVARDEPSWRASARPNLSSTTPDLLVTIGGDGTVLRAVHQFARPPPVMAVRMGRVGFLADTEPEGALEALRKALEGRFVKDECFMLENNVGLPDALNEVRVGTIVPSQMADMELRIDDRVIGRDLVDAVLVATNVGASAYTLSAGGAIVDPRLRAIVIVPVCPLSTNFRSFVVPPDTRVSLTQLRKPPVTVMVDGQFQKQVRAGVTVEVQASSRSVVFVRTGPDFYTRLKRRLTTSSLAAVS